MWSLSLFAGLSTRPWRDDTALICGRELLGYPKKLAEIRFDERDGRVSASVTRRGTKVLSMEAERGAAETSPTPIFDLKTFNVGGMGQSLAFSPIWLFRPREVIHESHDARVSVTLADSEHDPIARLASGDPAKGRTAVTDILGSRYMFPVGLAGPGWLGRAFSLRFR